MKKIIFSICILLIFNVLKAQTDSTKLINLDEVIISANKVEESKRRVAQQIHSLSAKQISQMNTQNTGDLLSATGLVMVQKSQQGGSSPILRGFEASRVLLVIIAAEVAAVAFLRKLRRDWSLEFFIVALLCSVKVELTD